MKMDMRLCQKPNGYWYVEFERNKYRSLKTRDKADANRLYAAMRREFLAGRLRDITGECSVTLGDFLKEYEPWVNDALPRSTARANLLGLRKLLNHAGESCRLDKISLKHVDLIIAEGKKAGLSTASINNYIRHARTALNKAVDWGNIKSNPIAHAKELQKLKKRPNYATADDFNKLLMSITDNELRSLVAAYLATGRRRTELVNLTWEDVDLGAGKYHVKKSKTHLSRDYAISSTFRTILETVNGERTGIVWPRWRHPDTVSHYIKSALRSAGLGNLRLHDLRHSFAAAYLKDGGTLIVLQGLLGHTEYRTTEIYAHIGNDTEAAEIERVSFNYANNLRIAK